MISDLIQDVNTAGLEVSISESGGLKLKGDRATVEKFSLVLKEHKPEIVAYLKGTQPDPADLFETYNERAGIMEYDGNLSRPESEHRNRLRENCKNQFPEITTTTPTTVTTLDQKNTASVVKVVSVVVVNPQTSKTSFSDPSDLFELFNERAAICEYDGGLSRPESEHRALEYVASLLPNLTGEELKAQAESLGAVWRPANQFFLRSHVHDGKMDEIYRAHWLAVWLTTGGFSPEESTRLAVMDCRLLRGYKGVRVLT